MLRSVADYNIAHEIRRDIIARAARVDALAPDRSKLIDLTPYFHINEKEPRFERIRSETTLDEKIEAWRLFFGPSRWNLIDWLWSLTRRKEKAVL